VSRIVSDPHVRQHHISRKNSIVKNQFKRIVAGAAAVAAISSGLAFTTSGVVSAATVGTVSISPTSGSVATLLSVLPNPSPAFCSGDSATDGYRVQAFIAPAVDDPNTYTFSPTGPTNASSGFSSVLFSNTGSPYANITTAPVSGQLGNFTNFDLSIFDSALVDGDYNVGYACTLAGAAIDTWFSPITVSGGNYGPLTVAAPAAPTAVAASPRDGGAEVTFTGSGTSFTVTATPGVGAAVTATGTASPVLVPGLTNGTSYDITVTATNAGGTSAASSPVVSVVPNTTLQAAGLAATSGAAAGEIRLTWTAPASATLTGYELTVTPTGEGAAVAGSPFTVGLVSEFIVSGLDTGEGYEFSLLPTTSNAAGETPVASTVLRTVASAQVLQQTIMVERPEGALILTQRCGVNNVLPGTALVDAFPGFPATTEIAASADQVGTSPDIELAAPGVQVDQEFGNYPFASPAVYPTRCIVDLGVATLITEGSLAGQYYSATGALDEVTLVDTRDVDAGWTVNAALPSLVEEDGDTFSGDLVGFNPVVSSTSDPVGASTYDQIATAGTATLPGAVGGLSNGQVWATAAAGSGLGVAVLDARVNVLIPVSNDAGTYIGTLEITVS
jgi:hypothetical protein